MVATDTMDAPPAVINSMAMDVAATDAMATDAAAMMHAAAAAIDTLAAAIDTATINSATIDDCGKVCSDGCGSDGCGGRGGGSVTSIAQARRQARGNNVPSNKNFVSKSSNRHYHNRLEKNPINVYAISARAASAAGISSPFTIGRCRWHLLAINYKHV